LSIERKSHVNIPFITLRRRSRRLWEEVYGLPVSAWRTLELDVPTRKYQTPRVFEQTIAMSGRQFQQMFIEDLGHDEPTILLTTYNGSTNSPKAWANPVPWKSRLANARVKDLGFRPGAPRLFSFMVESGKSAADISPLPGRAMAEAAARPSPWLDRWHKPVFIVCLLLWVTNVVWTVLGIDYFPGRGWVEGLFLLLATISTLTALGRRLPLQNVVATAVIIAAISGAVIALVSASGIPFGPILYSSMLGGRLFDLLPWPLPLAWIFIIVNGRGIARLIVRPWRKTNYYGFWVIGLTCLLAVILDIGLEPFAVHVKDYWIWQTPGSVPAWYVTALAILTFSMPWLINKQPIKQPIDYHPLMLWLMINIWIGAGNAVHHLWPAVVVSLIGNTLVGTYAIRGARW
jgi:uncharacterized membrane protein